jgi:hypothetical protein
MIQLSQIVTETLVDPLLGVLPLRIPFMSDGNAAHLLEVLTTGYAVGHRTVG